MPKRKRDEGGDGEEKTARTGGIKQQRVVYKLQQGVKRVAHAFKLAKGFERQKLSRRRKTATSQQKEQDVQRIDAEITALKALDHAAAAQQHVYKSLLKIKAVAIHPDLPAGVQKPPAKVTDAPTLNVVARLCKSNQAKEAVAPAIADVQNALGLEGGTVAKKKRKRAKDFEEGENGKAAKEESEVGKATREAQAPKGTGGHRSGVDNDSEDDEFAGYEDRIAMSDRDEEGSDEDNQSIGELERQLEAEGIKPKPAKPKSYDHAADLSISSPSPAPSPSPEPQKVASAPNKSSFLPTLTLGGYISGSGSDMDHDDVDVAPRKNRRGQRARQQLWEKKYGAGAKHLQKEREGRGAGWDAKRGATDGRERGGRGFGGRGRGGGGGGRGAPNGVGDGGKAPAKKHRDDDGAIHPSWAAAKKAKERKEAPVAFQGKKTTFD